MNGQRKKRRSLNLAEKLSVIEQYEKTGNTREIANLFGCCGQTIVNILKRKKEYMEDWANNADPRKIRYRPNGRLRALHFIVYEWVQRCRFYPMRITDQLIKQTGEDVAYILGVPDIQNTVGWVSRFKEKFKLSNYDLMNTERYEAVHASDDDKKSLDVESIAAEIKERYGNMVVPEILLTNIKEYQEFSEEPSGNKRLRMDFNAPEPYTSSSASFDSYIEEQQQGTIETIDLTESIHSNSDDEIEEDVVLVQLSSGSQNYPQNVSANTS